MKNLFNKLGLLALGVVGAVVSFGNSAKAAADADLAAGLASTTAIFADNKSQIILWIVGIFGIVIVIRLVIKLLGYGKRHIVGSVR